MVKQSHSWAYIQANYNSKRYMLFYVHKSTICNSSGMETTEMPIDNWKDKKDVVHIYNGTLLRHKMNEMPCPATWMELVIGWVK